ncbi:hypothetical protein LCL96_00230 [Rossellomorea aquimaris]|uniref:hypothetical protein n=1 Tax=Rossellomorea aquimaris TaxID=189382 RepID=UPI001CD71816|nr:hypothetical protein [Rossellomorea aquimaris]MCA1057339.1 hypothetical protein [Rossellomorea aquimaris]
MTSSPKPPELDKRKAEAGWSGPTSTTGKSLKALFAFGDFSVVTSRDYPPELDNQKAQAGWSEATK